MYTYIFIFVIVNDTVILLQGLGLHWSKGGYDAYICNIAFQFCFWINVLCYAVPLCRKINKKKKRLGAKKCINEMGWTVIVLQRMTWRYTPALDQVVLGLSHDAEQRSQSTGQQNKGTNWPKKKKAQPAKPGVSWWSCGFWLFIFSEASNEGGREA